MADRTGWPPADTVPDARLDAQTRNRRGAIIVARGEHALELSDSAALLWRRLDGKRSIRDLARQFEQEYGIDADEAVDDVTEALVGLADRGLVHWREPFDFSIIPDRLRERGLLPLSYEAIFVGGSVARGWQHANSDVDIYIVVQDGWESATSGANTVNLHPDRVPTEVLYTDGRRWEIRYWLDAQVEQVLSKLALVDGVPGPAAEHLGQVETVFCERLLRAGEVAGSSWIDQRRGQILESGFQALIVSRCLARADGCMEDAIGLLECGDPDSAVIAARMGFGHAVDALLASQGDINLEPKWRVRRMRALNPELLPFQRYWEIETMRSLDPAYPHVWVETLARLHREISLNAQL